MKWKFGWPFRKKKRHLVILDDFFPNLLTGFRVAEYNTYLEKIPELTILSAYADFDRCIEEYGALYPQFRHRVQKFQGVLPASCGLVYLNFLNNAMLFLPTIEAAQMPFLMTLYPGGGFGLNEPESDTKLQRVLLSPLLQGVITTQPITQSYVNRFFETDFIHDKASLIPTLLPEGEGSSLPSPSGRGIEGRDREFAEDALRRSSNTGLPARMRTASEGYFDGSNFPAMKCVNIDSPRKVSSWLIPGVVANPLYFQMGLVPTRKYFGRDKANFDLCFVAEKYMPRGANKGYPEFVATVHRLASTDERLRFHVVGSFTPEDEDVSALGGRLQFWGRLNTAELRTFFQDMDLIVSPSQPFKLHAGNFDGFPTGSSVEASLCAVGVMANDALNQNPGYIDGQDILLTTPDPEEMAQKILALLEAPQLVAALGQNGQRVTQKLYAPALQIGERLTILRSVAVAVGVQC